MCAFAFDPQANESMKEFSIGRVRVLLVRMNSDLAMGDVLLKKTGSGTCSRCSASRTSTIARDGDELTVEIKGVDVYNPTTGEIRSSGTGEIALWMIDTDYDGESFFVRHCYFTGDNDPYKRLKAALKADIDQDAWETLYQTKSRPFERPEKGKIAVKVINHYGDEVLQVYDGLTGGLHRGAAGGDRDARRAAADRGVRGVGQDPGDLAADRRDPARPGVEPRNIVAFTFTEKAAAELKERVTTLVTAELGDDDRAWPRCSSAPCTATRWTCCRPCGRDVQVRNVLSRHPDPAAHRPATAGRVGLTITDAMVNGTPKKLRRYVNSPL